jgi:5-methyltetrahydropteroyltriglutamate--homocysteine methyltransferase
MPVGSGAMGLHALVHLARSHPVAAKASRSTTKNAPLEETMQRTTAPFRADHVGSLLRPAALKEARAKRERGEITADALRAVEDREIEKAIRKQEDIGLKLTTDGEFRRSWYQFDFLKELDGVELYQVAEGIEFHGVKTKAESVRTIGRVGFSTHPHVADFCFLKKHTRVTPKMTIPAPNMLHFRPGRRSISKRVYPDLEPFFEDVADASRKALRAFYDAGCRYLQFDDTTWAMMCDERELAHSRERGDEPEKLPAVYARMINRALEGKPADMTVTMHSCRGNFRSTFIASGGYEPLAERLFNEVALDGYFLEYDSDRAGGFEPLRFFPKGKKQLVLGLLTSKSGKLEKKDDIKRRIDEATKYVALDQLCLSPQCGFASTEEGNVLSEDEQWAKLRLIVEIAEEVWGS